MAATFNPALSNAISRIRHAVGDTDVANAQVQDETILYFMNIPLSEGWAAVRVAEGLMAAAAKAVDLNVDDQLTKVSQTYDHYKALVASLTATASAPPISTTGSLADATVVGIKTFGIDDCRGPLDDCCP